MKIKLGALKRLLKEVASEDDGYVTPEQLFDQCSEGYAALELQNAEDPTRTPIEDLTFWKNEDGEFCMQDPADAGFSNIALTWDGEEWG